MKNIVSLTVILLLLIAGCTKRKESFLLGKWEDEPRVVNPTKRNVWTFRDDNTFTIENFLIKENEDSLITSIEGEYNFARKTNEYRLDINVVTGAINYYDVDGKYWVEDVDRDVLLMTREEYGVDTIPGNPFRRIEMVRL
ncbi:MAG: hypothetical protein R6U85_13875 [Salinivirgaceae bacterium]